MKQEEFLKCIMDNRPVFRKAGVLKSTLDKYEKVISKFYGAMNVAEIKNWSGSLTVVLRQHKDIWSSMPESAWEQYDKLGLNDLEEVVKLNKVLKEIKIVYQQRPRHDPKKVDRKKQPRRNNTGRDN